MRGFARLPAPSNVGRGCAPEKVCLARKDAQVGSVRGLAGLVVGTGSSDSPQAATVPLHWLQHTMGVAPKAIRSFDLDLGKKKAAVGERKNNVNVRG